MRHMIHVVTLGCLSLGSACATASATLPQREMGSGPQTVAVALTYHRPSGFLSAGRPGAFELVRDYRQSTDTEEFPGSWNDATQTLTASVVVGLKAENLVYLVDDALPPGVGTPISARTRPLDQTVCPQEVSAATSCYLLQVLR